jgi:hypothetical protein
MRNEYEIEWDKVYAKALPMNAVSLFAYFCAMQGEAVPIQASQQPDDQVQILKDAGLVVQSGNNLRIPRDYFRFL